MIDEISILTEKVPGCAYSQQVGVYNFFQEAARTADSGVHFPIRISAYAKIKE